MVSPETAKATNRPPCVNGTCRRNADTPGGKLVLPRELT
jgi:hypothetical protein